MMRSPVPWGVWLRQETYPEFLTPVLPASSRVAYVDIELTLDLPWEATRSYEYSKLYYDFSAKVGRGAPMHMGFSESRVICFRVPRAGERLRMRIALPDELRRAKALQFRIDPLPYSFGRYRIDAVELVEDGDRCAEHSRIADLRARKQRARESVIRGERGEIRDMVHLPESLCLELTPRCNLTCGHCGCHGTLELHREHNAMPELALDWMDRLAVTVFPSLTNVTTVGRGEPLLASEKVWSRLIAHLRTQHVMIAVVTNGMLIRERITPEVLPLIDTLTVSVDGLRPSTFATNRGDASVARIVENIRYYHDLRRRARLPRRPKLVLSWTLKKNNIAELREFLDVIEELEPDKLFTRHLLVYRERDRAESLLDDMENANRHLRAVYTRLEEFGITWECPPIAREAPRESGERSASQDERTSAEPEGVDPCMFVFRTANIHSDGTMPVCPRPQMPLAGDLRRASFPDIWFGAVYQDVRTRLYTDREMPQCRSCWYREARYHSQRFSLNVKRQQRCSPLQPVRYSKKAWDFTGGP